MPPLSTILARSFKRWLLPGRSLLYVPLSREICECEYVASMLNLVIGGYHTNLAGRKCRQRSRGTPCVLWNGLAKASGCCRSGEMFVPFDRAASAHRVKLDFRTT